MWSLCLAVTAEANARCEWEGFTALETITLCAYVQFSQKRMEFVCIFDTAYQTGQYLHLLGHLESSTPTAHQGNTTSSLRMAAAVVPLSRPHECLAFRWGVWPRVGPGISEGDQEDQENAIIRWYFWQLLELVGGLAGAATAASKCCQTVPSPSPRGHLEPARVSPADLGRHFSHCHPSNPKAWRAYCSLENSRWEQFRKALIKTPVHTLCVFLDIEREFVNASCWERQDVVQQLHENSLLSSDALGCLPLPCCFSPSLTTDWKISRAKFCSHHNMNRKYSTMSWCHVCAHWTL